MNTRTPAQAAQDTNRDSIGRFTEKHHAEAESFQPPDRPFRPTTAADRADRDRLSDHLAQLPDGWVVDTHCDDETPYADGTFELHLDDAFHPDHAGDRITIGAQMRVGRPDGSTPFDDLMDDQLRISVDRHRDWLTQEYATRR